MTQDVATKEPPSVIADMAAKFGMDRKAFEVTIKKTCMPADVVVSNEEFVAFLLVAKEYNLNPITKEIYAFPKRGGGIVPVVGVDGWSSMINRNPQLDGIKFEDIREGEKLIAIKCSLFRKDRKEPIECIEYMEECKRSNMDTWKTWPARMLRHKALIQCARYAFGLSGIYDPDEAERINMVDVTPKKRAFARVEDRTKFMADMMLKYDEAATVEDVESLWNDNKETMDALMGGSGADASVAASIDVAFMKAERRVKDDAEARRQSRLADDGIFDQTADEDIFSDIPGAFKQGAAS